LHLGLSSGLEASLFLCGKWDYNPSMLFGVFIVLLLVNNVHYVVKVYRVVVGCSVTKREREWVRREWTATAPNHPVMDNTQTQSDLSFLTSLLHLLTFTPINPSYTWIHKCLFLSTTTILLETKLQDRFTESVSLNSWSY